MEKKTTTQFQTELDIIYGDNVFGVLGKYTGCYDKILE